MDPDKRSSGNHPGIIDYKGASYVFGFNYTLNFAMTETHRERRSVTVAKFTYNADGTIAVVPWWDPEEVQQVGTLNPFTRVEAETIAWESGVRTAQSDQIGVYVTDIAKGSYIRVRGVDFSDDQASSFSARVASGSRGGTIELHLDRSDGPVIGSLAVLNTGGWYVWKTLSVPVSGAACVHDLYLVFKGAPNGHLLNFDYWKFNRQK